MSERSGADRRRLLGWAGLALVSFLPTLLSAPGKVAADTKQYLYLDPARLLGRAASLWDPNIGLGTVTHQTIGYVFPLGPYYLVMDRLGIPDWVAQRIWTGALVFGAAAGMLYLFRTLGVRGPGAVVGALAYAFSPYTMDYAARISVLLMPWAALGFLLGFTIRALREGGWRYPAAFALLVQFVGGVNATALLFAGLAPVLWILHARLVAREVDTRTAARVTARIGVLTVLTSLWWAAGLLMQGSYGLDILKFTETVRAVARTSTPNEVLRGLGYWFFYGQDRLGSWIEAAVNYTQQPFTILVGYGLVALSLLAAGFVRWRHRAYFVTLILVGTVVAVGAYPYDAPTPFGSVFKAFATSSTAGFALRSTGRAVPLVLLGLTVLLAQGVNLVADALARTGRPRLAYGAAGLVVLLVGLNFPALWDGTYYGKNLQRPEDIPQYWNEAVATLDAGSYDTRVLEVPGADFASYRWGNLVDPLTPGLMDRPYVARELVPWGGPAAQDLVNALDRRMQEGVSDPAGFVDVARLLGVGTVAARYDIQYERYNLVRPRELQRYLASVPGLRETDRFGDPLDDRPEIPYDDEIALASPPNDPAPPSVALFAVDDAEPIVRAETTARPLIIAGDGEGLVGAADIGLLRDRGVVLYSASYAGDEAALRSVAGDDAVLVLTDSNRRRARRWSTVRDNVGYTEQAGEEPLVADLSDSRLDSFPDAGDDAFTVSDLEGVRSVQASSYGNPISYTPEDRPANAVDGSLRTAWTVGAFSEVVGEHLRIGLDRPVTTSRIRLVQKQQGPQDRWITQVKLRFDDGDELVANLDARSRARRGQVIRFPSRSLRNLDIEILLTNFGGPRQLNRGAAAVGFSEVGILDDATNEPVRQREVVRMPTDLLDALGTASQDHPLVILVQRERVLAVPPRIDPEPVLRRVFELPTARRFALGGTARLVAAAEGGALDAALGQDAVPGAPEVLASESLAGCLGCRADAAIDGDLTTAWNTPFVGVRGQRAQYRVRRPVRIDHLDLAVVADGRHSVPTMVRLLVDGEQRDLPVPPLTDGSEENTVRRVRLPVDPPLEGSSIMVTVASTRTLETTNYYTDPAKVRMPVGIAEWGIPGLRRAPQSTRLPAGCRSDLLRIDGRRIPVRLRALSADAIAGKGIGVELCGRSVDLAAGRHEIETVPGVRTGVALDRLVLGSVAGGEAGLLDRARGAAGTVELDPPSQVPPQVQVLRSGRTSMRVAVTGATEPFWLVLGQSQNRGWQARVLGGDELGGSELVDGYANGWLIRPGPASSMTVDLTWTPQRTVWIGVAVSLVAAALCSALVALGVVRTRRRRLVAGPSHGGLAGAAVGAAVWPGDDDVRFAGVRRAPGRPAVRRIAASTLAMTVVGGVFVSPVVGVGVGLVTAIVLWFAPVQAVLSLGAAASIAGAGIFIAAKQLRDQLPPVFEWPTFFDRIRILGWLAVMLVVADLVVDLARNGRPAPPGAPGPNDTQLLERELLADVPQTSEAAPEASEAAPEASEAASPQPEAGPQ